MAEFACATYGLVAVPLYETLGTEALKHICNHCESSCRGKQHLALAASPLLIVNLINATHVILLPRVSLIQFIGVEGEGEVHSVTKQVELFLRPCLKLLVRGKG